MEELKTNTKSAEVLDHDPYAYLNRDFSSENYKIEIKNLPRFYGHGEVRKLLNEKLKLNSNKFKTPRKNSPYAFVCFRNEPDRDNALKVLAGYNWKGKVLQAIKAKPAPDPLVKKRQENVEDSSGSKRMKTEGKSLEEGLKLSTTPLADMSYSEQLALKHEDIKKVLMKLGHDLNHFNPSLKLWLEKQRSLHNGLPCELADIRFSELCNGYRNKCEFTVGINEETQLPTVGFRIGSYVNGLVGVGPVDSLLHVSDKMKKVCKVYETFVRSSKLDVFNPEIHTGHFRQLTIRTAKDQLMLIVGIHPQNLTAEELKSFKDQLVEHFENGEGKELSVTSLYYQPIVKKRSGEDHLGTEHLWGKTHIYETILGLNFKISPEAFFQINTKAAEVLYKSAIELASPCEDSTVLDVCCGTGTIGLCFSKHCKQVLGIEIITQAIEDAKENTKNNNIENAEFFAGKAEDTLGSVCFRSTGEDVVAIVDPPRAGLHQKAILQLRKIPKIKKIVYISCNPTAAQKNFVDLGRPESKTLSGEPFVPVKAIAVDMFPHTRHCELIICFERYNIVNTDT